jgi:hypothetical protein
VHAALPAIVGEASTGSASQQQTTSRSRRPVQSASALDGFASIFVGSVDPDPATHLTL